MARTVEIVDLHCMRCGYVWTPRVSVVRRCPKCKSHLWDVPRVRKKLGPRTGLGIPEVIGDRRKQVLEVIRKYGGRNPRGFGSVLSVQATPESDVDLLVDLPRRKFDLFDRLPLQRDLSRRLQRKVEVVQEENLRPIIKGQVLYEAVPL